MYYSTLLCHKGEKELQQLKKTRLEEKFVMADTTFRKQASFISLYKHTKLDQKNIAESLEWA